jgi:hypothetical protein
MAGINDAAAIARRAKALAERDGFAWEISFQPAIPGAKIKPQPQPQPQPQPYLDDERRQRYLDQARAELRNEGGDA